MSGGDPRSGRRVLRSGQQSPPKRLQVGALDGVLDQRLEFSLGAKAAKPFRYSVRNRAKAGVENLKDVLLPGFSGIFSDDFLDERRLDHDAFPSQDGQQVRIIIA